MSPLESLVACGTKLWLDSIDPDLIRANRQWGATGATSNPIIVADLVKTGRFDDQLRELAGQGLTDEQIAWQMTDRLVRNAQSVFLPVWSQTGGNDGYVSFEVDPLLEDPQLGPPHARRVAEYVRLGRQWAVGHNNRMIKVPATPAGLDALEDLAAAGVTLNVTLIFTSRQYRVARDAIWRGARRLANRDGFKSVYSIFVSRIDVYTEQHAAALSGAAQGQLGIVNAKRIWEENRRFWADKGLPLAQEMIFASTGTKKPEDQPWKYVAALAGSDIQTNPPATNDAVARSGLAFTRQVDSPTPPEVARELDETIDFAHLEATLMAEGIEKFARPQQALLALVGQKRKTLAVA
jgi:transaldolase